MIVDPHGQGSLETKCPTCRGLGKVDTVPGYDPRVKCPTCGGKGYPSVTDETPHHE